jgi:type IV secretory pathway VirB10-like protein
MNLNENNGSGKRELPLDLDESPEQQRQEFGPQQPPIMGANPPDLRDAEERVPASAYATRAEIKAGDGIGKTKMLLLGGGLLVAVLFFVFAALVGKSPRKTAKTQAPQQTQSQATNKPKGSVTPLMDAVRPPTSDNASGQLGPSDISRTRSTDGRNTNPKSIGGPGQKNTGSQPIASSSLGSIPSFSDTQQRWEEPRPYGEPSADSPERTQQQNALKEPSLVFVRSQSQNTSAAVAKTVDSGDDAPFLEMTPGTRIQAKLETQISSAVQAPVVAVVEYTYAIGNRVVIPSGARVYGQLQQADRSGYIGVKFDEIELLDGQREKIEAVGTGLDLGPIKGNVYGKNTGKNFLVRAASGMGSVLAEIAGNNSSAAFSENDMLRERLAENIGTAGDSEVMSLNANSRIVVSVPADTKIYIVFTKHEQSQSTLHRVPPTTP